MEMWDFILGIVKGVLIFAIIVAVIWIVIKITLYIITSIILAKHSKQKYGKSSILVWIPIVRLYYLGKEIHSDYLGFGLVALRILLMTDALVGTKILFFSAGTVFSLIVYGMFIYLYIKYDELKKEAVKEAKIVKEK